MDYHLWAPFRVLVVGPWDIRGRPDQRRCRGPGCGQGTHLRLLQTLMESTSPGESGCPTWKGHSNPMKLVPEKKLGGLEGKPTQAARRGTLAFGAPCSVESGLDDGRVCQEVLERRSGIARKRRDGSSLSVQEPSLKFIQQTFPEC